MSQNHYSTKCNRRPKNKRRKDYTRETMLKLRELRTTNVLTVSDLRKAVEILKRCSLQPVGGYYTVPRGGTQ